MRRTTWQNAIVLTLFGAAVATACVVSSDSDGIDDDDGGSSNTGGKAGSSTGGKAGSTAGSAGTTSVGGDTGMAGDTGTGGAAGGAGPGVDPQCDPAETGGQGGGGMVVGTPYPDCAPTNADDDCQVCIQESCCEASKNCNAYDPENVCGYGGPTNYVGNGGEFLCWQECINAKVQIPAGEGGAGGALPDVVTEEMSDECLFECATPECGLPGDETLAIAECVFNNCGEGVCFY